MYGEHSRPTPSCAQQERCEALTPLKLLTHDGPWNDAAGNRPGNLLHCHCPVGILLRSDDPEQAFVQPGGLRMARIQIEPPPPLREEHLSCHGSAVHVNVKDG